MDLRTLARYPFSANARTFVAKSGPDLEALLSSRAYGEARSLGVRRVEEALGEQKVREHGFTSDAECIQEMLSYPVARILVSFVGEERLVRWYAHGEAALALERLRADPGRVLLEVSRELGMSAREVSPGAHSLHFSQYVRHSAPLKGPDWKLINRSVERGWVHLPPGDLSRLCMEALRSRIESELPLPVPKELSRALPGELERVSRAYSDRLATVKEESFGTVSITKMPPCMTRLVTDSQTGVNIPHVGRFALAAFLHNIGMDAEGILAVFSVSPDFDPDKARYQIQHITGEGYGKEYTPPECDTMKTNGICFDPDELCSREWMNHPLTYYRVRDREERKRSATRKGPGEDAGDGDGNGSGGSGGGGAEGSPAPSGTGEGGH